MKGRYILVDVSVQGLWIVGWCVVVTADSPPNVTGRQDGPSLQC